MGNRPSPFGTSLKAADFCQCLSLSHLNFQRNATYAVEKHQSIFLTCYDRQQGNKTQASYILGQGQTHSIRLSLLVAGSHQLLCEPKTVTCPPRLQNGAPFHRSARPGVSACFEGSLRQWHQKIYTREGGLSFIFPSMRQAKKLNSTHRGEYLPLETHHKTENYKVLLKPQREVQTPSAAFYWKNLWGRPRFLFSRAQAQPKR